MACVGLKIGDLRHRLVLKTPTSTQDASGQVTRTFDTHSTVWGSLSPVSGREMESAHQISELVESKAVIRYNSAIKSEWRIEFDSRTFEILAILDFEERKVYQTLYLAEVK